MIVEYMMNKDEAGKIATPPWVTNGGFLPNQDDKTMIGFIEDTRDFYVPDTVTVYTAAELKSRSLSIHAETPYLNRDGSEMTESEVEQMVQSIIDHNTI